MLATEGLALNRDHQLFHLERGADTFLDFVHQHDCTNSAPLEIQPLLPQPAASNVAVRSSSSGPPSAP